LAVVVAAEEVAVATLMLVVALAVAEAAEAAMQHLVYFLVWQINLIQ
jgi:hypothetical protein